MPAPAARKLDAVAEQNVAQRRARLDLDGPPDRLESDADRHWCVNA
jgi:hypothetical protein